MIGTTCSLLMGAAAGDEEAATGEVAGSGGLGAFTGNFTIKDGRLGICPETTILSRL
jgi:hypothetical protein